MSLGERPAEARLVQNLIELTRRVDDRLAEPCLEHNVHPSRFAILHAVAETRDVGCSQTELAQRLKLSESNVCSLVERMRTAGLLFRFRSKSDRRKSLVMLTEQGRQLAEAIARAQDKQAESMLSVLTFEQQSKLRKLVDSVLTFLTSTSESDSDSAVAISHDLRTTRRAS